MNDLTQLLSRRASTDPAQLLKSLRDGLGADPAASGPAAGLHALLLGYFALDDVAVDADHQQAFHRHPEVAGQLATMMESEGLDTVAALMRSFLRGRPEPLGALKAALEGPAASQAAQFGPGIAAALDGFASVALGSPSAAAELELSLAWGAVEEALLDRVQEQAAHLDFAHGPAQRKLQREAEDSAALVARDGLATIFGALVSAASPRLLARHSDWDVEHDGAPAGEVEVPVVHRLQAPAAVAVPGGSAAAAVSALRALCACADGGELFVPLSHEPAEPGLELVPSAQWAEEREHVLMWLEMGAAPDDDDAPDWVQTLVPFARLPGDASRFVLVMEGPHAGAVMWSNDDLPDEHVRFASLAHFFATLRLRPQDVLGLGGYVSYVSPGDEHLLYPSGYREDPPPHQG